MQLRFSHHKMTYVVISHNFSSHKYSILKSDSVQFSMARPVHAPNQTISLMKRECPYSVLYFAICNNLAFTTLFSGKKISFLVLKRCWQTRSKTGSRTTKKRKCNTHKKWRMYSVHLHARVQHWTRSRKNIPNRTAVYSWIRFLATTTLPRDNKRNMQVSHAHTHEFFDVLILDVGLLPCYFALTYRSC